MFQYPYGDSQQLNLDWLMEQWQETKASIDGSLQGEIDRVEAAITDLLTARDQAVAAKTAAESAATSAAGYAGTASTAASTATAQAAAAAASAALAGSHANNAQTSETNAGLQATAAGNSASAAAVSEGNARNSELAAAASSSAAAGNALYAEGYAKGTQNGNPVSSGSPYYENNAKYYADQAAQDAQDAQDAATLLQPPATSADIGKALIVKTVGGGTVTSYELGESGGGGGGSVEIKTIENISVAHIEDAVPNDIKELKIEIAPVQSGTGNPSLDNVRPINGWTECKLWDKTVYDTTLPATETYPFPNAAGTVYGGTLTINDNGTGELIVTKAKLAPQSMTYTRQSPAYADEANNIYGLVFNIGNIFSEAGTIATNSLNAISNKLTCKPGKTGSNFVISNTLFVSVYSATPITKGAEAEAFMQNNDIYVVGILKTPITYQLTSQQVITLLQDENYIWADTGNIIKLKYDTYANTDGKIALVKAIIAPVEDDYIATQIYASNDFLIVDNTLYIVTANIANGATITPGTNVTATTVAAQLTTILNS